MSIILGIIIGYLIIAHLLAMGGWFSKLFNGGFGKGKGRYEP